MLRLPIIPSDVDATICLPDSSLPSFYMNDYSVLAHLVGDLAEAVRVLEKNGIRVAKSPGHIELSFEQRDQIPHVVQLLNANGISCGMADIVEHVYQG
ncbi:MAG: hypothetical protein PVH85_31205 [Desulfobacterales bacterium]|jgi:hypothetical protein